MPSSNDVWEVLSTARTIRRFTDEPVDDATLTRCLEAASWAPNGANAQAWRFVVLRSPEARAAVAEAARRALAVIEPVYGMTRPADDDTSRYARNNRATYELHDRAGERTSILFCTYKYETASELLLGGSIYPAMQNLILAARAQGLGACITSWASYGGEQVLRDALGIPDEWLLAGHVVLGWPRGKHGPVRRRPLGDVVDLDRFDQPAVALAGERTPGTDFDTLRFRGKLPDGETL
jgi:nitroreductase